MRLSSLPLPLAGEGWGEGCSRTDTLTPALSRKREREQRNTVQWTR
jgi:hypothetical protein